MQSAYTSLRDAGEASIMRYLQSDVSNFGRGASQGSLEQRAHDLVLHKRTFELARFDLVHKIHEIESRKVLEISEACVSGMYALRSHHRICENRFHSCDAYMAQLQKCQEQEKLNLVATMKPLEKKRRDVTSVLDAMVERVEMASSCLVSNDVSGAGAGAGAVTSPGGERGRDSSFIHPPQQQGDRSASPPPPTSSSSSSSTSSFSSLSRMGYNFIGGLTKNIGGGDKDRDRERERGGGSVTPPGIIGAGIGGIASMAMEGRSGRRMSVTSDQGGGEGSSSSHADHASQSDSTENCEARMKALDSSELGPFYHISAAVAPAGLVKQASSDIVKCCSVLYCVDVVLFLL